MLSQISLFQDLSPEEQLQLEQLGSSTWLELGEILFEQGDEGKYFYVLLEGEIRISRKIQGREFTLTTYGSGMFFGEVPILAGVPYFGEGKAIERCHIFLLQEDDFWQTLMLYPSVRKVVLGLMAKRMEDVQIRSQYREKLAALGTLAAGLAHELNNPASAARRTAEQLRDAIQNRHSFSLKHIEERLTSTQFAYLLRLRNDAIEHTTKSCRFEPLMQIDLEEEMADWLEEYDIANGRKLASTLVAGGLDVDQLEAISGQVPNNILGDVLTWLGLTLAELNALNVLDNSTTRISKLILAFKAYSYMDQPHLRKEDVDLHEGLEDTLTILGYKLRKNSVPIVREYASNLPRVRANGSALNQVWTNLIDNAIDALGAQGIIWVRTSAEKDHVFVEIADNGSGIPSEIQRRIFDPFFTTKEIGKGTGIGLNLVHRIVVAEHNGDIHCFSEPGCTSFRVSLPINVTLPAQA